MCRNVALSIASAAVLIQALTIGHAQSILDVLRRIEPGQPAAAQPAAAQPAEPVPTTTPAPAPAAAPAPALDTKPMFMSVLTNYVFITNRVIVTNYVVVTNQTYTTNFYNAQGQLLTLVPPTAGAPAPAAVPTSAAKPTGPSPEVIRANRLLALRELLTLSVRGASNALAPEGSFTRNPNQQIRIPEGVTVFDRKKSQTLTTAMNTAAEKAVPGAMAIIQKAVAQLNPSDPAQALQGGNDAATRSLITAEGQNIVNQVLSVVQGTAAEARVPEAYNAAMLRGGGLLGAVLGTTDSSVDMNAHITRGLMEAIVLALGSQEGAVRTDPTINKSTLLKSSLGGK